MIIPSNDAFIGNEDPLAYELFDAEGNFTGRVTIDIFASDIYDSGTEVNDGQGAAGFSLGLNGDGGTSTDDQSSAVAPHPDGNYLYQLEGLSGNIGVYELDGQGGLTQIQELTGELPEIDTQGLVSIG